MMKNKMKLEYNYFLEPFEFKFFVERRALDFNDYSPVIDDKAIINDWKIWVNEYPRNKFDPSIIQSIDQFIEFFNDK